VRRLMEREEDKKGIITSINRLYLSIIAIRT